jgi:hypothetical protein
MGGPKYQNVPQRDSLDNASYSQAPPSYQAQDPTREALITDAPRGEDDNLPDDFKFGGVVAEATLDSEYARGMPPLRRHSSGTKLMCCSSYGVCKKGVCYFVCMLILVR